MSFKRTICAALLGLCSLSAISQSIHDSGSAAVTIVADEHEITAKMDLVMNRAVAFSELELAVVMVESQVFALKSSSNFKRDIEAAKKLGVQFYVCQADLQMYKVSEASLMSKVRVVKDSHTTNVSGFYKHQSTINRICQTRKESI